MTDAPGPDPKPPGPGRRRAWAVAVLAVLVAGGAAGWWLLRPRPPAPPDIPATIQDEDARAAVAAARNDVIARPKSADAWGRLAMVLLGNEHIGPAVDECLVRAESLSPSEARWPYYRYILAKLNDQPTALDNHLRRAAGLASAGSEGGRAIRLRLAEALLARADLDEAEGLFRAELDRVPGDPRASHGLGLVALARGDAERAVPLLDAAARSDLARKRGTIYLAVAHRRLGHADEAVRLEQVARSLPEENDWPDPYMDDFHAYTRGPEAVHAEAKKLLDQGRTAEAVQMMVTHADRRPTADFRLRTGTMLAETGDLAGAEKQFRGVVALAPTNPMGHHYLALTLVVQAERAERAGDRAAAEPRYRDGAEHARRCLELKPDDGVAAAYLGRALLGLGQPAEAVGPLRRAVTLKPDLADAHLWLIDALMRTGRTDEAAEAVRVAEGTLGGKLGGRKELKRPSGK